MTGLQGGPDGAPTADSIRGLVSEDPELRSRYRAYRSRQAQALVSFLPQEAIRPLYAQARAWAADVGVRIGKDPLATLLLFLQELLPLPPFEVWLRDRAEHLPAHLEEEFTSAPAHRRISPPVTVESRPVSLGESHWRASLSLFRRDEIVRRIGGFKDVLFCGPDQNALFDSGLPRTKMSGNTELPGTWLVKRALLAFEREGPDPRDIGPIYIRKSDAEIGVT